MSKNGERVTQAAIIGFIITAATPAFPLLAWPLLIFDKLFPPDCSPEALFCPWSAAALLVALASELLIYSLLTYLVLRQRVFYFKRTGYIGKV
jgi:hypothetical protein